MDLKSLNGTLTMMTLMKCHMKQHSLGSTLFAKTKTMAREKTTIYGQSPSTLFTIPKSVSQLDLVLSSLLRAGVLDRIQLSKFFDNVLV